MRRSWLRSVVSCVVILGAVAANPSAAPTPFEGVWHGTLSSRNYAAVPVTLIINKGVGVKLAGALNLISPCLRDADLDVTMDGSNIVLAGSDPDGGTITL